MKSSRTMLVFKSKNLRTLGTEIIETVAVPIASIKEIKVVKYEGVTHMSGIQAQVTMKGADGDVYWSMESLDELLEKVEAR